MVVLNNECWQVFGTFILSPRDLGVVQSHTLDLRGDWVGDSGLSPMLTWDVKGG